MSDWPGNPVASMTVPVVGPAILRNWPVSTTQVVSDPYHITFRVDINFAGGGAASPTPGTGYYSLTVRRLTTAGWEFLASGSKELKRTVLAASDPNFIYGVPTKDALAVSIDLTKAKPPVQPTEQYQLDLYCEWRTQGPSFARGPIPVVPGHEVFEVTAVSRRAFLGDFTLNFLPITIVYCPPGAEMTNSLTQSLSFGTRFSLGGSSGMESDSSAKFTIDILGILGGGFDWSSSKSITNKSSSGIEISHFRTTVVTSDNARAVGQEFWGPLGDLFVIAVSPKFAASKDAEGTILYSLKDIEQVMFVPAWKLLRPDNDPIASLIPSTVRKHILALDPFITNLQLFFPDSGAPLSKAANPYVDPSSNNRAELIGRWLLDSGSELNYELEDKVELSSTQTNELEYKTNAKINAEASGEYKDIKLGLALDQTDEVTVSYEASQETTASSSRSVACFLIRKQDDLDLDGIDLYYDKIFSTLMFRRVRSGFSILGSGPGSSPGTPSPFPPVPPNQPGPAGPTGSDERAYGSIVGVVTNPARVPLRGLQVYLEDADHAVVQTSTSSTGRYGFCNLKTGRYILTAGDRSLRVSVGPEFSPVRPRVVDVVNAKRILDLKSAYVWEVSEALGLSFEQTMNLSKNLRRVRDVTSLAAIVGVERDKIAQWNRTVKFQWSRARRVAKSSGRYRPGKRER